MQHHKREPDDQARYRRRAFLAGGAKDHKGEQECGD